MDRLGYAARSTCVYETGSPRLSFVDRILVRGVRAVRRLIVTVVGLTILLAGFALIFLPGPAFVVIPVGLAVLALEFEWARRLLRRARDAWSPPGPKAP
ncbi:MAG: PGPGW domain-containing protein [Myxococcota bacterium]